MMTVARCRAHWLLVACSLAAAGCQLSELERFEAQVVPVLERSCLASTCHGVLPDAEARGEVIDWSHFHVRILPDGRVADVPQAYDITKTRIDPHRPDLSTLLRKPLAPRAGGLVHAGGAQLAHPDAADYRALRAWIAAEADGGESSLAPDLSEHQELFAREVLPHLAARQCMNGACHGPVAPFTAFEPPVIIDGEPVFSLEAIRRNYAAARMHLFLGGDPMSSRLLRKGLPLDRGGIAHRGGNDIFFVSRAGDARADPAVRAILTWAEAEQRREMGAEVAAVRGIVFVRGPVPAEAPFTQAPFQPGSDLFVLEPPTPDGALRNLTAALRDGPAEVRDPAVRHDGRRIAFAMRRSPDDALNIYEVDVDGGNPLQLTFDRAALPGGGTAANVQPTYGPDGRIYFASTRSGHLADAGDVLDSEIWAVAPSTGALERITFDPSPEATPSFIGVGKAYGTLAFTMRRTIGDRYEAPVFRMPLDHNRAYHNDPELHIHHGVSLGGRIVYGLRTLPDGRHPAVLLEPDNRWRAGTLAILERQFGPEIPRGHEPDAAVAGFRHALASVDADAAPGGLSPGGVYRRPTPLPDGRILISWAPGPIDLDDPGVEPDFGLYVVELDERGGSPRLGARRLLLDQPGLADYDAEPIVARPLEDDPSHEHAWDTERRSDTGTLALRHVETLEAIFANLEQRGPKPLRDDLAFLRLVAAEPITPDQALAAPIGASGHALQRVLAEVPLAGGSVYLEVPADRPFRLQFLNQDRMAVGAQLNRWIHVAPGELFPGGVDPRLYPTLCASCHGALSGDPADVGGPVPDAITAASMTLATHRNLDPRRPLEPARVGDAPIDVDFRRDLAPVLARACATSGCHEGRRAAGGLDLRAGAGQRFDAAYEALLAPGAGSGGGRRYVDASGSSAYASYLTEILFGRELGAPRALASECPAPAHLSDDERLRFVRWIDLGASYRGAP